jgi:hypothetical protein
MAGFYEANPDVTQHVIISIASEVKVRYEAKINSNIQEWNKY